MGNSNKLNRNKRTEAAKRRAAEQPNRTIKHFKAHPNDKQTGDKL